MADETTVQTVVKEKPKLVWHGHDEENPRDLLDDAKLDLSRVQADLAHCVSSLYVLREFALEHETDAHISHTIFLIYKVLNDFHTRLSSLCPELETMHEELVTLLAENTKLKQAIGKQHMKK